MASSDRTQSSDAGEATLIDRVDEELDELIKQRPPSGGERSASGISAGHSDVDEEDVHTLLTMPGPQEDRSAAGLRPGSSAADVTRLKLPTVQRGAAGTAANGRTAGTRSQPRPQRWRRKPKGRRARVTVQCGSCAVVVPELKLGECNQTARWLAVVAQQRASMAPHMRRKLTGFRAGAGVAKVQGYYAPSALLTPRGTRIHPATKLSELFEDSTDAGGGGGAGMSGKTLTTKQRDRERATKRRRQKLRRKADPDVLELVLVLEPKRTNPAFMIEDAPPHQPTWSAEAFNFSDSGVKKTEVLRERDRIEAEEMARAVSYVQDMANRSKFERLKRLMVADMESSDTVQLSFEAEWGDIRVEALTEDKAEIEAIKRMLCTHWVAISDVYKHFSGSSDVGRTDEMSLVELTHCLMKMNDFVDPSEACINILTDRRTLAKVFEEANEGRGHSDDAHSLTRFEFVEVLINWASFKFGESRNGTPLSTAMARLLINHVVPAAVSLHSGEIRKALISKEMAGFFSKALPRLRKVFLYYCRTDREDDDNTHTMSLREFCQMLVDAGIYVRDRTKRRSDDITMKQVRMAFSGVQNESTTRHIDDILRSGADGEAGDGTMHGSYSTPVLPPVFEQAPQHLPPTHSTAALTLQLPPAQGPPRASKLGHRLSSKTPHSKSAASLHARPSASQFALLDPHALMEQPQLAQHESLKEMQIQLERAKVEADTTNELVLNEMVEAVARIALQKPFPTHDPPLTKLQKLRAVLKMVARLDKAIDMQYMHGHHSGAAPVLQPLTSTASIINTSGAGDGSSDAANRETGAPGSSKLRS